MIPPAQHRAAMGSLRLGRFVGVTQRLLPQLIHGGIPGSTFYRFRRCGHLPAMEAPGETSELLRRWLTD